MSVVGRWSAGHGHWHEGPCYLVVLERLSTKWLVTYWEHGEQHACIGFDDEAEARDDVDWLRQVAPVNPDEWLSEA